MAPGTSDRGDETRRRILAAAVELFCAHGIAGTSVNDVIHAGGVTKGGFYFHFPSKAELAAEVLRAIADEQREDIVAAVGVHERAIDQLAALARAAAGAHPNASAAALCRLGFEIAGTEGPPPPGAFDEWFALTADLIRRAQLEGDADPDVDPQFAGRYVVTAFVGFEHVAELLRDRISLVDDVEPFLELTFRACGLRLPVPPPSVGRRDGATLAREAL